MAVERYYLNGVGVTFEGVEGWDALRAIIQGERAYDPAPLPKYSPQVLPANERRRASQLVRLSFRAIEQLLDRLSHLDYAMVFASSGGDYDIVHKITQALAQDDKIVSPTQFHNSVHNAPAGYWSIATENTLPSTTVCAHDFSFAMGMLESFSQLHAGQESVLLSNYDLYVPAPLGDCRIVKNNFSSAFLLSSQANENSLCKMSIEILPGTTCSKLEGHPVLEEVRLYNAAARSLALLVAIISKQPRAYLTLDNDQHLSISLDYDC